MKKLIQSISLALMCILQGCSGQPTKKDIIGVWVAEDGGKFSFEENGSFSTENLSGSKIFSGFDKYDDMKFSEQGTWELSEGSVIILDFEKSDNLQGGFSTQLSISGEGLLENNPPWYLFAWIGDPDDMNKYKFEKQ